MESTPSHLLLFLELACPPVSFRVQPSVLGCPVKSPQHQVRGWEHGASCCLTRLQSCRLALPIPSLNRKVWWAADCQNLRLPPLRVFWHPPDLSAVPCFKCRKSQVFIRASLLHVWATDQSLSGRYLGACQTSGISGPASARLESQPYPSSDDEPALESERRAEAESPREKPNCQLRTPEN